MKIVYDFACITDTYRYRVVFVGGKHEAFAVQAMRMDVVSPPPRISEGVPKVQAHGLAHEAHPQARGGMMAHTKATPTPWKFDGGWIEQVDPDGDTVACFDDPNAHADARLIVAAVNAYAPMVAALEAAQSVEAALILQWTDFWEVAPSELIDSLLQSQTLRNAALALARKDAE